MMIKHYLVCLDEGSIHFCSSNHFYIFSLQLVILQMKLFVNLLAITLCLLFHKDNVKSDRNYSFVIKLLQ